MVISTLISNQIIQPPFINNNRTLNLQLLRVQPKEKVVVVMGATGTGKSRLSLEIATRFPAEIINSDKIQAYKGLNTTTNKLTHEEMNNVPHHLLGVLDHDQDFTPSDFRHMATLATESITSRGLLPIIAGGSNSYIEALLDENNHEFHSMYECCFLWVDVSTRVLHSFVSDRVDRMVEKGMVDEVRKIFDYENHDYTRGIRKAIGVPEFDSYFRRSMELGLSGEETCSKLLLKEAIEKVKGNTRKLSCRQLDKIYRLKDKKGWKLHRLDATRVFELQGEGTEEEAWERHVARPSMAILRRFLFDHDRHPNNNMFYEKGPATVRQIKSMEAAVATAAH
ncbi:adenylate isopentenyltransferase 3, chloroplastic-like [Impatiens glandulifera]|uniref:adenylate isopentenyltransferase 3, chloroplastic-like n=1 Tax=Impatiens glandulifera TaxID=253017 RepID=UPI001FB0B287|nr:adenylate isopentenyltransferase 3, chloroplastic-like [Impatiens glandulifera]